MAIGASAQDSPYRAPSALVRNGTLQVDVDGTKPLFQAVHELQGLCGCPITYEDAPLENADDMVELSPPGGKAGARGLVPKRGALAVSYALRGSDLREDVEGAVREVIRVYEDRRLPGRFTVEREGAMLHVIPSQVRSKSGQLVPVTSVLETAITLPEREWAAPEALQAILDSVQEASGVSVRLVDYPINLLNRHKARLGADHEPARVVLARLLMTHPRPMSWGVGYDISTQRYGIGIHVVRLRRASP